MLLIDLPIFVATTVSSTVFYLCAQRELYPKDWKREILFFPFVLALDQLWAIAPFLLLPQIGVGLAFAATAALLYVPFSERTLVRLGYREG